MSSTPPRDEHLELGVLIVPEEKARRVSFAAAITSWLVKPAGFAEIPKTRYRRWLQRVRWVHLSFLQFVVLPSASAIVYFAFIATPQYAAEARFVVRAAESTPQPSGEISVSSVSLPLTYSASAQNAYIVTQYILSRGMLDDLSRMLDLRQIYRRPEADFLSRLDANARVEDLLDYWRTMTRAYVDGPSGIVTVEVSAFRPSDAVELVRAVLELSERLVNQMSERVRQDMVRNSEDAVKRADASVRTVLQELQQLRDRSGLIDPVKAADDTSKLLLRLMADKISTESDLYSATRSLDANSPTVRQLRVRLEKTNEQIATLGTRLTGSLSDNVASSIRKFEELEVQRQLAEKLLSFAESGLERARMRAERQNLYFMVFDPADLPTKPKYPDRLAYAMLIPFALCILWGIVVLFIATIEDHRY